MQVICVYARARLYALTYTHTHGILVLVTLPRIRQNTFSHTPRTYMHHIEYLSLKSCMYVLQSQFASKKGSFNSVKKPSQIIDTKYHIYIYDYFQAVVRARQHSQLFQRALMHTLHARTTHTHTHNICKSIYAQSHFRRSKAHKLTALRSLILNLRFRSDKKRRTGCILSRRRS